jgi:hypothetical protein
MAVAAMILVYSSPGVRSGLLLAILGSAVVLYHQVGSFYLALLLALVAFLFLPYLLLAGHRKGATALLLSLAALGLLSLFYAWDTYDIGRLAVGLLGGSDTGAGGTAVAIAIGSQEPLTLGHLLRTTSQPVAWLGLLGALLVASEILRKRAGTPRALAYLTVLLWALLLFAGSRTSYSGFPQRFERDLGIPLALLAALALVEVLRLARPSRSPQAPFATRLVAALAATLAVVVVGVYGAQNVKDAGRPSAAVVSEEVAAAGGWLGEHNTGGNIVVTPYLNDHVPGSAMLAMGGYTGLRSYTRERLRTPRALPPSGKEPLLADHAPPRRSAHRSPARPLRHPVRGPVQGVPCRVLARLRSGARGVREGLRERRRGRLRPARASRAGRLADSTKPIAAQARGVPAGCQGCPAQDEAKCTSSSVVRRSRTSRWSRSS